MIKNKIINNSNSSKLNSYINEINNQNKYK